jgi:hypothetical protein
VPGTLQADEFGNVFEILAKNVLPALGKNGYGSHAEPKQLIVADRIV